MICFMYAQQEHINNNMLISVTLNVISLTQDTFTYIYIMIYIILVAQLMSKKTTET